MKWLKFKLVANWKSAWSWLSMQFIGLAVLWESIPEEAKDAVFSDDSQGRVTFWLIVAAGLGRLKDQGTAQ
jgi:hypothetical protein